MSHIQSAFVAAMAGVLLLGLSAFPAAAQNDDEPVQEVDYFVVLSKWNSIAGEWQEVLPRRGPFDRAEAIEVFKELLVEFPSDEFYQHEILAVPKAPVDEDIEDGDTSNFRVLVRKQNPFTKVWEVVFTSEAFDDCESAAQYAVTLQVDFPAPMYRISAPDCPDEDGDGSGDGDGSDGDGDGDGSDGNGGGGDSDALFDRLLAFFSRFFAALREFFQSLFG